MSDAQRSYLSVESLDERLVPSATPAVLDLTTNGAERTAPSGAVVQQVSPQPTGTGYIRSFVRFQGPTPATPSGVQHRRPAAPVRRELQPAVHAVAHARPGPGRLHNGAYYREFLLDINQKSSSPFLSLDEARIFLGGSGNLHNASLKTLGGNGAVFDLDTNGNVSVMLDARLNSGSGSGDMVLLVPNEAFNGADPKSSVTLYSKMGGPTGATPTAGSRSGPSAPGRRTATASPAPSSPATAAASAPTPPPPLPSPPSGSLSGVVIFDANQNGVIDSLQEHPIKDVVIHLSGTTAAGAPVDLTTATLADGSYSFTGLEAGDYILWEEQPQGMPPYVDGNDYVGTVANVPNGTLDEFGIYNFDAILDIHLEAGQQGINYNFTEKFHE